MSVSRSVCVALVATALLFASLPGGEAALAQTKGDVDEARQEANRAKSALSDAQQVADQANLVRSGVEADLLSRLDAVERTSADLDVVSSKVIELRGQIEDAELLVRSLRTSADERAVEAYMSSWSTDIGLVVLSADLTQALVLEDVAETAREDDLAQINELTIQRRILNELRSDQESEQQRLRRIQDDLTSQVNVLEQLFLQADVEVRAAFLAVDESDRQYRAARSKAVVAQRAYDEAQRRLRIGRGVERWRPLVQKYFPPELIDQALAVMYCESGGDPDATNPRSNAAGLFQFLRGTWAIASVRAGFGGYSRLDPEANIASAAWLVDYSIRTRHPAGAWGHWSCRP
ncbi:transglycosylase SLT domain protein [bacterium BMS3Abin02]|nr:transglycosylase SLT domain protein [bacterium BMS3Abin02]GBE21458.1 transglycosylase SLT domain protein [bacterium BMS3Bbin01]HDH25515.1 hypothetical protein [Actinomycetota bacterium]HDL49480.1 hypothetical protein [Actinomycetota bacterium]